jgi:hypothetical protein
VCPPELDYLWLWFCQVCTAERLTFSELDSWMRLSRRNLEPWEVEALMMLDRVRAKESANDS